MKKTRSRKSRDTVPLNTVAVGIRIFCSVIIVNKNNKRRVHIGNV